MQKSKFFTSVIISICVVTADVFAQMPHIDSLSTYELTRSGRLRIFGSSFGNSIGSSQVLIDGHSAIISRWNNNQINAYVPEQSGPGIVSVQVVTTAGSSNTIPLTVTLRQQDGRIKWIFEADVENLWFRPAIAPDGTLYLHGSDGFVFALTPDGGLKWIYKVNWYAYVPPNVGSDGTVYVGSIQRITAINPNGTQRWQFTDSGTQGVQSGPAIGPDGNIYLGNDFGLGAYCLSPNGQLLWNNPGNPPINWYGGTGCETVLGPSVNGGAIDQMYIVAEPQLASWTLQAFSLSDGSQRFSVSIGGQDYPFGQQQTQPVLGSNGTIYITHMSSIGGIGWVLEAYSPVNGQSLWYYHGNANSGMTAPDVGPDGIVYYSEDISRIIAFNPNTLTPNWQYSDGTLMYHPTVSPVNDVVVTGGVITFGDVGFIKAIDVSSGQLLWTVPLPGAFYPEPRVFPVHHPRFSPDGTTVYVSTTILGGSVTDPHSFLYAIAAGDTTINVELVSFNASVANNDVTLSWTTSTETNNSGFEIQRKKYKEAYINTGWNDIGFVKGNGTTTNPSTYFFVDADVKTDKYSYRLKQVDFDGSFKYSDVIEVEVNSIPARFSLEQNYPNPFNPNTTIEFQIPEEGFVSLKIYDVLGNEAAILVNEDKQPGTYKINYDAGQLASGVYYYQLSANNFSETKKFILLK